MADNNQDRSQDEGQQGIDRETEQRNRENETGEAGSQQFGQDKTQEDSPSPSGEERASSAFGQPGQSAGGDTTLSQRTGQTGEQNTTGAAAFGQSGGQGGSSFVGSTGDQSSDYLTKGEENQDFAPEGQGAEDSSAGRSDIETGQPQDRDPSPDEGSDTDR